MCLCNSTLLLEAIPQVSDKDKSQEQLINELAELRRQVAELEQRNRKLSTTGETTQNKVLEESEARYRSLVETPDIVVMLMDLEGQYLYVSPQVESFIGYKPEEFYADPAIGHRIGHPDDQARTDQAFYQARQGQTTQNLEFRWVDKGGNTGWASESIFPEYDRDGNVHTIQALFQDITERKRPGPDALYRPRDQSHPLHRHRRRLGDSRSGRHHPETLWRGGNPQQGTGNTGITLELMDNPIPALPPPSLPPSQ